MNSILRTSKSKAKTHVALVLALNILFGLLAHGTPVATVPNVLLVLFHVHKLMLSSEVHRCGRNRNAGMKPSSSRNNG